MAHSGEILEAPLFDLPAPAEQRYGEYVATTWGRENAPFVALEALAAVFISLCVFLWWSMPPSYRAENPSPIGRALTSAAPWLMPACIFLIFLPLLIIAVVMRPPAWLYQVGGSWVPRALVRHPGFLGPYATSFYCPGAPERPFSRARLSRGRLVVGEGEGESVPWSSVGKVFLSRRRRMLVLRAYGHGGRKDVIVDVSPLGREGVSELQRLLDEVLPEGCLRFDRGVPSTDRRTSLRWDPWDPKPKGWVG